MDNGAEMVPFPTEVKKDENDQKYDKQQGRN